MSRTAKKNPSSSFEALAAQRAAGKPQPAMKTTRLPVKSIKVRPEVFQHRRPAQHVSDARIRTLAHAAKLQGALAPLTVWWDGKHWTCIGWMHGS